MVQILESLALRFECLQHEFLFWVCAIARALRHLNSLDSKYLSRIDIECQIHLSVGTLSNQLATDPRNDASAEAIFDTHGCSIGRIRWSNGRIWSTRRPSSARSPKPLIYIRGDFFHLVPPELGTPLS